MQHSASDSYKAAGVDVNAGYEAVHRMKAHVERTRIPGVIGGLGGFGGLFAPDLAGYETPVFVSGADGVGTKLRLAFLLDKHHTIGIDCVAMCVNDILCSGAKPLFFLDYIACGKNQPSRIEQIVAGVAEGCVQAGCALIGGETAEMPGFYPEDEYDLAGFAVGLADQAKMLDPAQVQVGDVLIALPSSGPHSNGFSLIRKVFDIDTNSKPLFHVYSELDCSLGDALLAPTRIYVKPVLSLLSLSPVHGICHITGGGFHENIPRMLPPGLSAQLDLSALPVPPVFSLIAQAGQIPQSEMYHTFNMGAGLLLAVPEDTVDTALSLLKDEGEAPFLLGRVVPGEREVIL